MSMTAIYVFTATKFTVNAPSTIEQLAKNGAGVYVVVPKTFDANAPFTLQPGVYRLDSETKITAASGLAAAAVSVTGTTASPTSHIIARSGTKGNWPDPGAVAASTALNIPLDTMRPFLTDAGEEVVLEPAPPVNG